METLNGFLMIQRRMTALKVSNVTRLHQPLTAKIVSYEKNSPLTDLYKLFIVLQVVNTGNRNDDYNV